MRGLPSHMGTGVGPPGGVRSPLGNPPCAEPRPVAQRRPHPPPARTEVWPVVTALGSRRSQVPGPGRVAHKSPAGGPIARATRVTWNPALAAHAWLSPPAGGPYPNTWISNHSGDPHGVSGASHFPRSCIVVAHSPLSCSSTPPHGRLPKRSFYGQWLIPWSGGADEWPGVPAAQPGCVWAASRGQARVQPRASPVSRIGSRDATRAAGTTGASPADLRRHAGRSPPHKWCVLTSRFGSGTDDPRLCRRHTV